MNRNKLSELKVDDVSLFDALLEQEGYIANICGKWYPTQKAKGKYYTFVRGENYNHISWCQYFTVELCAKHNVRCKIRRI